VSQVLNQCPTRNKYVKYTVYGHDIGHSYNENIIKLRVKTRESMPETQSNFLFKWKDQTSKITCEMIQNQNKKSVLWK